MGLSMEASGTSPASIVSSSSSCPKDEEYSISRREPLLSPSPAGVDKTGSWRLDLNEFRLPERSPGDHEAGRCNSVPFRRLLRTPGTGKS